MSNNFYTQLSTSTATNLNAAMASFNAAAASLTTGVNTLTMTMQAATNSFQVYANGNLATSNMPLRPRKQKKRLRQVSPICTKKAAAGHVRCAGVLPGSKIPAEGMWCACLCHPEPVPPGEATTRSWLAARRVWDDARRRLDLSVAANGWQDRAAELVRIRRQREQEAAQREAS